MQCSQYLQNAHGILKRLNQGKWSSAAEAWSLTFHTILSDGRLIRTSADPISSSARRSESARDSFYNILTTESR